MEQYGSEEVMQRFRELPKFETSRLENFENSKYSPGRKDIYFP